MDVAQHNILGARTASGFSGRRTLIIGTVGLLHVGAIYALVMGMKPGDILRAVKEIQVVTVPTKETPPQPPAPPQPRIDHPVDTVTPTITPPIVDVAPDQDVIRLPPKPANPSPPVPDTVAISVASTHTTPPYPALAARLAHQGQVLLQLSISAGGNVTGASVVKTSGFGELDEAAVSWVIAHWRYKPAIQNGVAVPSQTQAIVKFDLRQVNG
ncbi:MAG: energy transducer TonB [Proteobacteria bacterium]|nr:energy transducer TonB [Pseudomonadota bacterium]